MRKLMVSEFMSLDGGMEAPGGEPGYRHSGWVIEHMGEEQMAYKLAEVLAAELLLLGRITYEGFAAAWPERDGPFAEQMNGMPKHVVSRMLRDPAWANTTVLAGEPMAAVRRLKEGDGGPILVAGSCTLVHALLHAGFVDELRVMVFPVVLGSGLRVFPAAPDKLGYRLTDAQRFASGVIALEYAPAAG